MSVEKQNAEVRENVPFHIIEASVDAACNLYESDIAFDKERSREAIILREELDLSYRYATVDRLEKLAAAIDGHFSRAMKKMDQTDRHTGAIAEHSPLIRSLLVTYWHASRILLTGARRDRPTEFMSE